MTNQALENAKAEIADAFRAERKERTHIIAQGHRVKFLVQDGGRGYYDACQQMEVTHPMVADAFYWLVDDNSRMNAKYEVSTHRMTPGDYIMVGWFLEQEDNKICAFNQIADAAE